MLNGLLNRTGIIGKLFFCSVFAVPVSPAIGQPSISENKVINLLSRKPDQAMAVLPYGYQDPVFYFDRNDWYKELEAYTNDPEEKKKYMACHDSIQNLIGNVPLEKLHTYGEGHKGLNTGHISEEIFVKLLTEGKAFVKYADGLNVAVVKTKRRDYKRGYAIEFRDGKKIIYHMSYKTKGSF